MSLKVKAPFYSAMALAALTSTAAQAEHQGYDKRWTISPMVQHYDSDKIRFAEDTFGGQLSVGRKISNNLKLEGKLFHVQMDSDASNNPPDSANFKVTGLGVDALWLFRPDATFNPYVVLGAQHVRTTEFGDRNANNPGADLGVGFLWKVNDYGVAVRGDVRARWDAYDKKGRGVTEFLDIVTSLGLDIPLAANHKESLPDDTQPLPPAAPFTEVKPADSDADGIPDNRDRCPNSYPGAPVNPRGCEADDDNDGIANSGDRCPNTPRGTPVNTKGCELDSDLDGVPDARDGCPGTRRGARVDAIGCTNDADNDGVANEADRCPGTAPGTRVDRSGCSAPVVRTAPTPQKVESKVLNGVHFAYRSARLNGKSKRILDEYVDRLRASATLVVEIAGHTDNIGGNKYNQSLSQRRAEAVRRYLISRGVPKQRMIPRGYGESLPIATNSTEQGRYTNRRVEMIVLSH